MCMKRILIAFFKIMDGENVATMNGLFRAFVVLIAAFILYRLLYGRRIKIKIKKKKRKKKKEG